MTHITPLTEARLFINENQAREIAKQFGTPVYVYSEQRIRERAKILISMPNAFGLKARFAMKACPTAAVIQILNECGLGIDASSGYEAERALLRGVAPEDISLTAQELPENLAQLLERGIDMNACSLEQIRLAGLALAQLPADRRVIGVRFNPGLGSGHSNRTNVGGPSSGFGIWRDYLPQVKALAAEHGLKIVRVHSHVGSGADPKIWENCARMTLDLAVQLPDVTTVSLGGGFKVARMPDDPESNLHETGISVAEQFRRVQAETGRRFLLEVEPGAFLMAPNGALVTKVIDRVDTGSEGYQFLKIDSGMTEIIRPSMYGAQHPIVVVPQTPEQKSETSGPFLVIGHCCESGDILTPEPGNPEGLAPRALGAAAIGDILVIGATGAYTSGFSTVNYNSFPQAAEVLLRLDGTFKLVRRRQELQQVIENEIPL